MNNIKQILAIAILGIFAVACTDENEMLDNVKSNNLLKSTTTSKRDYPQYENVDYASSDLNSMLTEFNDIVNSPSAQLQDKTIEKYLYIMETYLNYGVIDKANSVATKDNDVLHTFTFTVPIDANGNVKGNGLKDLYRDFVVGVLTTMRGTVMPLSDMYVKELSSTSVTFGLDITPYKVPADPNVRSHFPTFYGVGDNINVPANVNSAWGQWFVNQQTPWGSWPAGTEIVENNVYQYSKKPITANFSLNTGTYFTYYTGVVSDDYLHKQGDSYKNLYDYLNTLPVTLPTTVYYDNVGIATILIPAVLNRFSTLYTISNAYMNLGTRVLCDYTPKLYQNGNFSYEEDGSNQYAGFFLYVSDAKFAFKHVEQPLMYYYLIFS